MRRRAEVEAMCSDLVRGANLAREQATKSEPEESKYLLDCARTWQHVARHRADDRGNCAGCRQTAAPCLELTRQHGLAKRLVLAPAAV
jgi:hypothetical protein